MKRGINRKSAIVPVLILCGIIGLTAPLQAQSTNKQMGIPESVDPIHETYIQVVTDDFETIMEKDVQEKPEFMKRQQELLERRYDLSDNPSEVMMSAGRMPVQKGVRVKLPKGMTWEKLSMTSPEEIKQKDVFPEGFLPLPHAKHETGGQVIPENHIEEIMNL